MGICFIGKKNNFESFLTKYIDPISGRFVDIENEKEIPNIRHNGVHNFTIGKRIHLHGKRGGNNSLQSHISGNEALYVCNIDASTQTIYLVSKDAIQLGKIVCFLQCRSSAHPKLYAKRLRMFIFHS
jgi:tRNA U34 2-thiouridine synthase MnmA/TrmU